MSCRRDYVCRQPPRCACDGQTSLESLRLPGGAAGQLIRGALAPRPSVSLLVRSPPCAYTRPKREQQRSQAGEGAMGYRRHEHH